MRDRGVGRGATFLIATALVLSLGAVVAPAAPAAPAATPTTTTTGYLTMADGVQLAYTVVRPQRGGRFPTLFEYSGYFPGRAPDPAYIRQFVEQDGGYAYIGVSIRGTGCSTGTFDFFEPEQAADGAAAIAWIRQQPWSNGRVGMIGKSYPGITQLFVAEQHPPGLVAIAPGHFFADAYRDIGAPGGIANYGFASLWSFVGRPSYEFEGGPTEVLQGDTGCLRASLGEIVGLPTNPYVQLLQHPYDDALYDERSPDTHLADLADIPMLATLAWQDEQLGSRQTHLLAQLDDLGATDWWATLTDGDHGMARTAPELADLERFYDHFLKGEDNGWEQRPRVQVWWDAGRNGPRAPGWVTALDHWSEAERAASGTLTPWALSLHDGGRLDASPPTGAEPPTAYTYVPIAGSQGIANPAYALAGLPNGYLWDNPPPAGTAASFTTEPFASDVTVLGSASLDLWLTASAPDIDLQATITEVRPDGQEVFVQQGWLRASQRKLDPARSTELRPYQTHRQTDVAPLTSGQPVLARLEVFPFGQLFRAASRLRVWIEAPTFLPQLWAFTPSPLPAEVQILHDAQHPSRLVLPLVPNDPGRVETLPACGSVIRQPCRPDPLHALAASPGTPAAVVPTPSSTTPPPTVEAGRLPATGREDRSTGIWAAGALVIGLLAAAARRRAAR